MHHRLEPKKHSFHYDIFMFYLDLDEIEMLSKKLRFMSYNRFNLFNYKDSEHLQLPRENPDKTKTTKQHITHFLSENGVEIGKGKIMLLTGLNTLGYNFNPVSFYYCFNEQNEAICAIAEVSNTFKEMKPYFLSKEQLNEGVFKLNTKKHFYVSPFFDHDTNFDFNLPLPGEKLNIRIDDYKDDKRIFISTLTGEKEALTDRKLLGFFLSIPFVSLKVITLFHWNAMLLWLKKIPYRKKGEHLELQKEVFNAYKQ